MTGDTDRLTTVPQFLTELGGSFHALGGHALVAVVVGPAWPPRPVRSRTEIHLFGAGAPEMAAAAVALRAELGETAPLGIGARIAAALRLLRTGRPDV
ncbi:MAG: hypothetical protein AB7O45_13085 [Alphaproteobacteria bacterium]